MPAPGSSAAPSTSADDPGSASPVAPSAGASGSQRAPASAAADAEADERRAQPRLSHDQPNPEAAAAAVSSSGATEAEQPRPPAARLYRHALESVFAFLGLRELATALRVSADWLAAVKSMTSLDLAVHKKPSSLAAMAESLLGRHVVQLGSRQQTLPLTADSLSLLSRRMPRLRVLHSHWRTVQGRLTFPAGLRRLNLRVFSGPDSMADVNAAIAAISRLPLLESLDVRLSSFGGQVSFAPLATMPLLRDLCISTPQDGAELSDAQVEEMRALPHLSRLHVDPMSTSLLRRLLVQPHALQWQSIALPWTFDGDAAACLPQLPSLTRLESLSSCARFDWLRGLPSLVEVRLNLDESGRPGQAESLVGGLRQCARIEWLALAYCDGLTTAHLSELLPRLPRLRQLELSGLGIDSLSFLAQAAVTSSLRGLRLHCCKQLPLGELQHLHSLRGLQSLCVDRSFCTPMDAHTQSHYTPPSLLLPQLEEFEYKASRS